MTKTSKEKFDKLKTHHAKACSREIEKNKKHGMTFDPIADAYEAGAEWAYAYAKAEMAAKDALLEEMGKALEFYGDKKNWATGRFKNLGHYIIINNSGDGWNIAMEALAKFKAHKGDGE